MDIYLFNPSEYQRLYNCSLYKIDDIPLEKRQHIFLGNTNSDQGWAQETFSKNAKRNARPKINAKRKKRKTQERKK
uniref:Transposase n=1 Tax=Meloidogyne hapla TaxID=6305 RepID=A0A1I8BF77_MELHA